MKSALVKFDASTDTTSPAPPSDSTHPVAVRAAIATPDALPAPAFPVFGRTDRPAGFVRHCFVPVCTVVFL